MRASYISINLEDVQQAVKEVARFIAEPNEGACSTVWFGTLWARAGDLGAEAGEGTTRGH